MPSSGQEPVPHDRSKGRGESGGYARFAMDLSL
eukprot:CAMPEP_0175221956 /NCGR_PEP_ID=MMETSP0093-20121207/20573_1 /TAXON_ID=311494 /ORGANISM="Alexandrium monilatum, Strain CCMP3105" /LENGTH=32 /DNA_ID= /DNA_START= /DNA_END= /DNA_ORIENTATION=